MILIQGGRVISPKNGLDGIYDLLIDGDYPTDLAARLAEV